MNRNKFQQIEQLAEEFIKYNEQTGAFRLYEEITKILELENLKAADPKQYAQYQGLLIKLKVFVINFFEEDDYFDLIKNNFEVTFEIIDYDFWEKIRLLLILEYDFFKRDELKNKFKKALLECKRPLLNANNYKNFDLPTNVADWLKDFVANLGLDKVDQVKKQEYLVGGKFVKLLSKGDQEKIKKLLELYEKLNVPSSVKEGMDNSVPMEIDNKFFVLDQGNVGDLSNSLRLIRKVEKIEAPVSALSKPQSSATVSAAPQSALSSFALRPEDMLKDYSPNSLEYKAIKEEIARQKKTNAKK